MTPHTIEAPIALANAAIESHDWEEARKALKPLLDERLTQRVCTLMARIEAEQHGDAGRVREWLARAVNAPRDPTWTADGITSEHWAPVSPVSGELDAFEWRVPVESVDKVDGAILTQKLEEFLAIGSSAEPVIDAPAKGIKDVTADIDAAMPAPPAKEAAAEPKAPTAERVAVTATVATSASAVNAADREAKEPSEKPDAVESPTSEGRAAGNNSGKASQSSRPAAIVVAPAEPVTPAEVTIESAAPDKASVSGKNADDGPSTGAHGKHQDVVDLKTVPATTKSTRSPKKPSVRKSAATKKAGSTPAGKKDDPAAEAKIFVPPRAPDDPGTDLRKSKNPATSPLAALRSRPAKGSA